MTLPMAAQRLETGEGFTTSLTVEGHVGLNVCDELGLGCEGCAAHGAEFGRGRVGQGFSIVDSEIRPDRKPRLDHSGRRSFFN